MSITAEQARRRQHHEDPALNRSLVRGVEILRAFRPGADQLGNGEIAERTHLSRATVSRLTQTLVECGLLEHDRARRTYRLAPPVLSFAHAMHAGSPVLSAVAPLMRALAEKLRINVGIATADRDEMVYLDSFRFNRKVALRSVVAGQRVPMELTSLGRAYLAVVSSEERRTLLQHFRDRRPADWARLRDELDAAKVSIDRNKYCSASWQPEVVAIASPLVLPERPIYILNVSVRTTTGIVATEKQLCRPLLTLCAEARAAMLAADA
ncbi:IclR family transcriptional regulator [Caballeronia sordidicola]|uniref:IclR family transcriptional regulator n=1 Tax=Caballeronia sordidicola TaxID=196367 RepID=A0A158I1F5_CABSO|nr:helix-turn-helix domain-containing protein [Caballeronia sordidicola]SAL49921.1 IclR family transcriptional regulator [Caballeronia sordidicola]